MAKFGHLVKPNYQKYRKFVAPLDGKPHHNELVCRNCPDGIEEVHYDHSLVFKEDLPEDFEPTVQASSDKPSSHLPIKESIKESSSEGPQPPIPPKSELSPDFGVEPTPLPFFITDR